MNKIAVFLAKGFEEIEALTVVDLCRRAGLKVCMVSVEDSLTVEGSHGICVLADSMFEAVDFEALDMLVLPGGMPGTRNLEAHAGLMEQVDAFDRQGRYLAAICAAPSILGHRGILNGKRACCYPGYEEQLSGAEATKESVVRSEHVIMARGMGCAIPFGLAIISVFCGREKARELAAGIVYES